MTVGETAVAVATPLAKQASEFILKEFAAAAFAGTIIFRK